MFFRDGSELADVSGKLFPHPALLFVARNGVLFVRDHNRRPDRDTKVAAAPDWNIESNVGVCTQAHSAQDFGSLAWFRLCFRLQR
jgi:hypothetical protein